MNLRRPTSLMLSALAVLALGAGDALAQQTPTGQVLLGTSCTGTTPTQVTEPGTGRTYMLDYPCDLRPGEEVTLILSLHGAGSNASWQRRYFPAFTYKESHRLVIATPFSPTRTWSANDDQYLQNIVVTLVNEIGPQRIRAFWLAGHSQGGITSRRLVCTDFFASRVDGFLSLSGGRIGGTAPRSATAGRPAQAGDPAPAPAPTPAPSGAPVATAALPDCDFSHIFAIGEHEIASLPTTSAWAQKYGCSARVQLPSIVDTEPGMVHDGSRQDPGTRSWGLLPRPGTADVFQYPGCRDGRVVADVVRLDKGHTEGLEPLVTRELVRLMLTEPGGKIRGR